MIVKAEINLPRATLEQLTDADLRWMEAEVSRRVAEATHRLIGEMADEMINGTAPAGAPRPRGILHAACQPNAWRP